MKNTALITGASTGIGCELAHIHAEHGGDLVIVARRRDKLEALKTQLEEKYKIKVVVIVKDLIAPKATQELYDEIANQQIQIDYLINNAGFGGIGVFHERDWEKDLAMINLNIVALTALTRLFLPDFVQRNAGKILNVSSTASLLPGPMQAVYYATKAYVTSFSNAIAEELHDTNISVTTLMPGPTATEFGAISDMDKTALFRTTATAKSVAKAAYKAMLKGKLDIIAGVSWGQKLMFLALPFLPKSMKLSQVRKLQAIR